jgi:glyoxylase-like metal-dependent hydrolase (beta-lactamase superfamily II)
VREILEGVHHWTAVHPNIGAEVSSYYLAPARTLIDPMATDEAIAWLRDHGERPDRIVLTNRHHLRGSQRFREEFECRILCHRSGLYEFRDGPPVEGFAFGDELAPKLRAHEVAVICEEETALHVDRGPGALAVGDALVNYGGIRFVSDNLLGSNPGTVKEGLGRSFARLLDLPFDAILFAHGEPITEGGMDALREFLAE